MGRGLSHVAFEGPAIFFMMTVSDHNNVITRQEILTVVRSIFDMVGPNASESLGDDTPEERVERVFGLMARVSFIQGSVKRQSMGRSSLRSSGKVLGCRELS